MLSSTLKRLTPILVCLGVAILVAGKALYPGYIILLDMGWAPTFPLEWSQDGLNNVYPVYAVIHFLTLLLPSWVVQKLLLLGMLTLLLYIPWRYLPYITSTYARMFASLVFALNPFVYARILSGQWFHVIGYALLPFLLYALVQLVKNPGSMRAQARLVVALLSIGLFSIHFLYLGIVITIIWLVKHIFWSKVQNWSKVLRSSGHQVNTEMIESGKLKVESEIQNSYTNTNTSIDTKKLFFSSIVVLFFFVLFSAYWLVPAYLRDTPLETRFDIAHYQAFASAANRSIPVMQNVFALGGFWSEGYAWRYFFVFPQESELFWVAFMCIILFILIGIRTMLRSKRVRYSALILVGIGIMAYITALGASNTPFRSFNLFLYEHLPLFGGLRDSNKIVGILALVYAVFSGMGVQALLEKLQVKSTKLKVHANMNSLSDFLLSTFNSLLLLVPIVYGLYMWGGLHNQLQAVYYPHEWREAKEMLDELPKGKKVLVLPWHAYLSLPFANNRVVANPLQSYFGNNRIIMGRDVGIGQVHDQEVDETYKALDALITHAYMIKPNELVDTLKAYGIVGILFVVNPLITGSEKGLTKWTEYSEEETSTTTEKIDTPWLDLLPKKITKKSFGQYLILITI